MIHEAARRAGEREERRSEVVQFKGVRLNNSAGGVWAALMQQVAAARPKKEITARIGTFLLSEME